MKLRREKGGNKGLLDPLEMVWLDRLNLLKSGHLLDTTLLKLVMILPVNLFLNKVKTFLKVRRQVVVVTLVKWLNIQLYTKVSGLSPTFVVI